MKKIFCVVVTLLVTVTPSFQQAGAQTNQKTKYTNGVSDPSLVGPLKKQIMALERKRDQLERRIGEAEDTLMPLEATVDLLKAENEDLVARVTALQTAVTKLVTDNLNLDARTDSLEDAANKLIAENGDLAEKETELETTETTLQSQITDLEARTAGYQAFFDHVAVNPVDITGLKGPHVIFTGANLHVRSGSGRTDDSGRGSGNLIVGYNEDLFENPRTGSHNVVVGVGHGYSSWGGFVTGFGNTVSGPQASVSGGAENTAGGYAASIRGDRWLETVDDYSYAP